MKKILMKSMALTIMSVMLIGNMPVVANAEETENKVRTLSYEEYLEQVELEEKGYVVSDNDSEMDDEIKNVEDLLKGKPVIECDNIDTQAEQSSNKESEDIVISEDSGIAQVENDGIVPYAAPQAGLRMIYMNPETLKNGQPTTETQIAWIWNFSDEDGDVLLQRRISGFPEVYILGALENDLGFATQFSDPGHYTVNYWVMDTGGEISESSYTVDVVPVEDFQIIEGDFTSLDEVQTYEVEVDYSTIDTAAFCLVRTGKSNVLMRIIDESGTQLAYRSTSATGGRRWYFLDKPSSNATVETYTITVNATSYEPGSSGFRVLIGDKNDVEPMISGPENAVWIDLYSEAKMNNYPTSYTPNRDESWYRFTSDGATVFTLLTCYPETRFQVREVSTLGIIYDSDRVETAHRTQFCPTAFDHVEKDRMILTAGRDYYLVIYAVSEISPLPFVEQSINVAVGNPYTSSGSTTAFATSSVTATSSAYSASRSIRVGDNGLTIPTTAVAKSVLFQTTTSGITQSKIDYWRIQAPNTSLWVNSNRFASTIDMDYKKDSTNNKNINGTWQISLQAANSTITLVPGIYITYNYEWGD